MTVTARWRSADGEGLEHLVLEETSTGYRVDAAVVGSVDGALFAARWYLAIDASWRTRRLDVDLAGVDRRLALLGDGEGRWTNADGVPLPALAGAIDVDLLASPFTNTLPIRRLRLPVGGSADILVAWVSFPTLEVHAAPQRYTRLADRRWRFRSLDADFERDIDVDEHGLVVDYPDLFSRVL
jgi:hypothetical protein